MPDATNASPYRWYSTRGRQTWRPSTACACPPRCLRKALGRGNCAQGTAHSRSQHVRLSAGSHSSPLSSSDCHLSAVHHNTLSISCLQYVAWVELVIISLVTPNASFLGHLAGILAGLLHIAVIDRGAGDHVSCPQQAPRSFPASAPSFCFVVHCNARV